MNKHIPIKNIYYMLSYAFKALNQKNYESIAGEEFDNIQNLFAAILSKGIAQQLKQGLYREYSGRKDDIPTVRGKIDMPGTIKHTAVRERILSCEYDELSENNQMNRIIKTTAMLLLQSGDVKGKYKDILKKEMLCFSDVDLINPSSIAWDRLRFHRNNQTYRMLIGICRFILRGMLLTTERGEYKLASFADDRQMYDLYEKFLLEYYRAEFPDINVSSLQIDWALDDGSRDMLPIMQSDIVLSNKGKTLIIDAKYYSRVMQSQYDTKTVHSNNLYQIFTYVKNMAAQQTEPRKVSGMLLYARTDEDIQPNQTYRMSGNTIAVRTLDLNCEFDNIKGQLNEIVEEFLKNF